MNDDIFPDRQWCSRRELTKRFEDFYTVPGDCGNDERPVPQGRIVVLISSTQQPNNALSREGPEI